MSSKSPSKTTHFLEILPILSYHILTSFCKYCKKHLEVKHMTQQTRLYFQKTGILLAVYLTLRFLLPLVLPFALSWLTVAALTFVQKKTNVPLLSLGICYILLFLLLSAISIFCGCYLLYDPCCRLLPICQAYWSQFSEYLTWIPESLSGYLAIAMPSALSCLFGVFL